MTTSSTRMKLYWRTARSTMLFVPIRYTIYDVIVPHVVDSNNGRGVYSRAAFRRCGVCSRAAFIQGRRLIRYIMNYNNNNNNLTTALVIINNTAKYK